LFLAAIKINGNAAGGENQTVFFIKKSGSVARGLSGSGKNSPVTVSAGHDHLRLLLCPDADEISRIHFTKLLLIKTLSDATNFSNL